MTVKKTFPKILWLIFSSSIFFIILYFALFYYTKKAEKQVYNTTVEQFDNEVKKLLEVNSKPILVAINNDTSWDEFVKFINSKDAKWYNETIGNELEIYEANYLAVYDANKNFMIRTPTSKIKTIDFIPKEEMELLNKVGVNKFYLKIPEGIVEVTGAAIHPSNDPLKKKTKTSGYFFVVRLMDIKYIKNLEKLTSSSIIFTDTDVNLPTKKNQISSLYILKDSNNKFVGKLLFKRNFEVYFENAIRILYIIIVAFIINLLVNLIYTRKLVYYPLDLVRRALESGNRKAIKDL